MSSDDKLNPVANRVLLSIVIVSWNVRELLQVCLNSIRDNLNSSSWKWEVIVVDSASDDGSQLMIREEYPRVRLVACSENVGFAQGNNIGINLSRGQYILLLNPDTEIVDDALQTMVRYMQSHSNIGILGARLLNPDGSPQSSRRRFPSLWTGLFESTWLDSKAPKRILKDYYMTDLPDDEVSEVDWLVGACLLTRREVIESVGLLDEAYFMYSEELDWCRRVKEAGWQIVYFPHAEIIHHVGKSSEQAVVQRHINFQRAKLRYFRKFHGLWITTLLRAFLILIYAWQLSLEAVKGLIGHKRALRFQRVSVYWQVLRSGLKPAGY